ncbi:MAG: NADP-dependent oxidoreductase [Candidatus Cybelea sp.]|jgi:NADPH:quinone reductase-like Zn-dependent oxidoreductase
MPKAVQLAAYGGIEQLRIVEVAKPDPAEGEIVVRVVAAGTNPGEISIREGLLKDVFPMEFPFGQGTDFSGRIDSVGAGVTGFAPGDKVLGWTDGRAAQAEYVATTPPQLIPKPPPLDWFRAGSLFVVATTAVAAVRAVSLKPGDVVAVSGAAGGVGSLAVQLARRTSARVIGIASDENAPFLRSVGVEPVAYGEGLAQRLQALAPKGLDAFIDLFGGGYVELAATLGVSRINTVIDFAGAEKYGTKTDGSSAAASRETIALVADLIAWGEIVMPLTAIYPFALVRDAYIELAHRKARGKIVLAFDATISEPLRPPMPDGARISLTEGTP